MAQKGQGKWAQGAKGKWEKGAVGKWKKGAVGKWKQALKEQDEVSAHGSAETGTTGFAKQYSKSPYRTSGFAMGPGKMEFGKSGTGKKKPSAGAKSVKPKARPKPKKKK